MADQGKVLIREVSTSTVGQPRLPGVCSVVIKVHDVAAAPQEQTLTSGSIVLGAGHGADVIIGDESVSRRHLQITLSNQGIEVVDLNSSNGTYYQGQRIGRLTLDREATFLLGRVKVTVAPQLEVAASSDAEASRYGDLIGRSSPMWHLFANLAQLETKTVPVLIEGEPGTGKALTARVIHERSSLHDGPLVVVNCASLEPSTARAELFGVQGDNSTNSTKAKSGAVDTAHGGTLVLREVEDLALDVQPILLAALEHACVLRADDGVMMAGEGKEL